MTLLIDSREKRVLFAEAGKECVDFLFYTLSLPVATVIRLLSEEGMEGSLPTLYNSLENLDDNYIEPNKKKETYLKPVTSLFWASKMLQLERKLAAVSVTTANAVTPRIILLSLAALLEKCKRCQNAAVW